jgi:hypothetical protein
VGARPLRAHTLTPPLQPSPRPEAPARLRCGRGAQACAVAALLTFACSPSAAWALDLSLYTQHRGYAETLPDAVAFAQPARLRSTITSTGGSRQLAYQFVVVGRLAGRPLPWLSLELGLDSGLIGLGKGGVTLDGGSFGARLKETGMLGETFAEVQLGEEGVVMIRAGKLLLDVGGGAVLSGYALGLELDVDASYAAPDWPWFARARALLPDATFTSRGKQSPLLELELGRHLGDAQQGRLAVFGALFMDGGDELAEFLQSATPQAPAACLASVLAAETLPCKLLAGAAEVSGTLGWAGLHGRWRDGTLDARGMVVLGVGGIHAAWLGRLGRAREVDFGVTSLLASLEGHVTVATPLKVGGFLLVATGDDRASSVEEARDYTSFIGLAPRLPLTSIFFGGGLATTLQSATVAAVSPDGSGIVSAGLDVAVAPWGPGTAEAVLQGAVMSATRASASGSLYGVEVGLRVEAYPSEDVQVFASGAVLVPGAYYGNAALAGQVYLGAAIALGDP